MSRSINKCRQYLVIWLFTVPLAWAQGGLFEERPPCIGTDCCSAQNDEFSRQFACAMMAYLDLDPVLQLEGCAKHSQACRAMCTGKAYRNLMTQYGACDKQHDKDTALGDWYSCFFEALISGAVNGIAFMDTETEPPSAATTPYCELFGQAGCPLCVALRLRSSPCIFEPVQSVCPRVCKACKCLPPRLKDYQAISFSGCPDGDAEWGTTCRPVCTTGFTSVGEIECKNGGWVGTQGPAACMADCNSTNITLPRNASSIALHQTGGSCDLMKHDDKCQLNCQAGTSPTGWWQCYNGSIRSTVPGRQPECLKDCGEPPVPAYAQSWGTCIHPVLDDPAYQSTSTQANAEAAAEVLLQLLSQAILSASVPEANGTNLSFNGSFNGTNLSFNGTNLTPTINGTALRDALDDNNLGDSMFAVCKALQDDNANRPVVNQWNWTRRLTMLLEKARQVSPLAARLHRHLQVMFTDANGTSSNVSSDDLLNELTGIAVDAAGMDNITNTSNSSVNVEAPIFVPLTTPSASTCSIVCSEPFTPLGEYVCWDGEWTVPQCTVQLMQEGLRWPRAGSTVVSPLGGIYMNFNNVVITGSTTSAQGRMVEVCGRDGPGCPLASDCFAAVPVEDTARVSVEDKELRIRLDPEALNQQIYGCEYSIKVPDSTVFAVANRSVGNDESLWWYRLVKPPPSLLTLREESGYKDVLVTALYDNPGTIKCLTIRDGTRPTQENFDSEANFYVQGGVDVPSIFTLKNLQEQTVYELFCQAIGIQGNRQSLVSVYDNSIKFTTKTKIPFALNLIAVEVSNKHIVLSVFYSTQSKVRCSAQQSEVGVFARTELEEAVLAVEEEVAMTFYVAPKEFEIKDLLPGMPTQILCRAVKKEGNDEFWQPLSDSWINVLTLDTPPMTSTALGELKVQGCELVPPFTPTVSLYACALTGGVLGTTATVAFTASVPQGDFSTLECGGGSWTLACSGSLEVVSGKRATWRVQVKSQAGHVDPVIVAVMSEPPLVPKEIYPKRFQATQQDANMTVCIQGEPDKLPESMDNVSAELLPGPWKLEVLQMRLGADNLVGCACSATGACNMELLLGVKGAGANLTLVLLVNGFPSFTLLPEMRINFDAPVITDVDPPLASMYRPTKIIIRGSNFGHSASVGAAVTVWKVGPVISLPPGQWFGDCPSLIVQLPDFSETAAPYAGMEFNGRYDFKSRNNYEMNMDITIDVTPEEIAQLPPTIRSASPNAPETRVELGDQYSGIRSNFIQRIGMCCYQRLAAKQLLSIDSDTGAGKLIVERLGRRKPRIRLVGKVWDFESRAVQNLRLSSADTSLGRDSGWILKYKIVYPDPGKNPPAWRRLAQQSPALGQRFQRHVTAWTGGLPGNDGSYDDDEEGGGDYDGLQRRLHSRQLEEKKCKDDSKRMKTFLKNVDIEVPGWIGWLVTCKTVTRWRKDLCIGLMLVCECSCADYENLPITVQFPGDMSVDCERCGDGLLIGREYCDDGNLREDDGCNFFCEVEDGWMCIEEDGGSRCVRENGEQDPLRNLCGPTTWENDNTMSCELIASTQTPLVLSVDLAGQRTEPSSWVQYQKPSISSFSPPAGSASRRLAEMPAAEFSMAAERRLASSGLVLEFVGNQELVFQGRGLPPDEDSGKKTPVAVLLEDTLLCVDLEITSSVEIKCFATQPINLDMVPADPMITVRVDQMSSDPVPLSVFGMPFRRPVVIGMSPNTFNDTDEKVIEIQTENAGTSDYGTLAVTIGPSNCTVLFHSPKLVRCLLAYIPIGTWTLQMNLGSLEANNNVTATSVPTLCPIGMRRKYVETSQCLDCPMGKAEPEVNADFTCPDCSDKMYQNDTGSAYCRDCMSNAFSVGDRSTRENCRCESGHYHPHSDEATARECSACETERGFGWATSNWTIDCEDCVERYTLAPEKMEGWGLCPLKCYGLQCDPCPFGTVCFGHAAWPRVLPGFFSEKIYRSQATEVQRCMPMEACMGEDGSGNMICAQGYAGLRCGVCILGYYKEQHTCVICPENQWIWGFLFAMFFLCVLIFGVIPAQMLFMCRLLGIDAQLPIMWRLACLLPRKCLTRCKRTKSGVSSCFECCQRCSSKRMLDCAAQIKDVDRQIRQAPLLRTLSMCLNFGHTCYAFSMLQRPAVKWPGPSWELLSWTKLLTVDVEFMKPDCIVPLPYFTKWIGKFCFPFGLAAILLAVTLYLKRKIRFHLYSVKGSHASVWGAFAFTLALLIHVTLIWHLKVVLSPIDCNWCREGVTCLDENVLVECWSDDPTWKKMIVISMLDFTFISGAFPVFLMFLIVRAWRMDIDTEDGSEHVESQLSSRLRSFTSFFVSAYRGRKDGGSLLTFGWEVVILFRKLFLLLAAKFTTTNPVQGANYQLIILLMSLLGQCVLRPYSRKILNWADNILNTLEFFVLLTACQLTMGVDEPLETFYIAVNVVSLFGGALMAVAICLRKLQMAWEEEASRRSATDAARKLSKAATDSDGSEWDSDHAPVHPALPNDKSEEPELGEDETTVPDFPHASVAKPFMTAKWSTAIADESNPKDAPHPSAAKPVVTRDWLPTIPDEGGKDIPLASIATPGMMSNLHPLSPIGGDHEETPQTPRMESDSDDMEREEVEDEDRDSEASAELDV